MPLSELAALIDRFAQHDGAHSTAIAGLRMFRSSLPSKLVPSVYEPALCLIAQGRKRVMLAENIYPYDRAHYLLVSVELPVFGQVIEATPAVPYLGMRLGIDPMEISVLMAEAGLPAMSSRAVEGHGLSVGCFDVPLLDAVVRLLRLLETPQHIGVLAPMVTREILYRLLVGEQGVNLRRAALTGGKALGVIEALHWLRRNFAEPLQVNALAGQVHMSPSVFHRHFKAVAAMTPLQYQKQIRLQEARRLMLAEAVDAATAGYRVGYESASQFSREYRRLFGEPPLRDMERVRQSSHYQIG